MPIIGRELLEDVAAVAIAAGHVILAHYKAGTAEKIRLKVDQSPVTLADMDADQIITEGLKKIESEWPILSEEQPIPAFSIRKDWPCFWCVDPLDGTRGFINKTDDFVVSIALVKGQQSVLGVIYSPVDELLYFACEGEGAYKKAQGSSPIKINTRKVQLDDLSIALSRTYKSKRMAAVLNKFEIKREMNIGSAIKSCLVAEGKVDLYPRIGPTCAWDTAAAQCILQQAGGQIIDLHGRALRYNTKESLQNPSFLAVGDLEHNWLDYFRSLL